jgi:succinate-acetate transporter protein
MMLQACENSLLEWDFSETTPRKPGILAVRLTDVQEAMKEETEGGRAFPDRGKQAAASGQHANTTPVGLFSFSMMVGLETVGLMSNMFPDLVDPSYVISWGPYMFFVGGVLQVITGTLQVFRNNLYGATAFLTFGCFWFSNGAIAILKTHFSDAGSRAEELLQSPDPGGAFFRQVFILMFCCVLLKQTLVMNRLSTTLITLLCCKVAAGSLTGYSEAMKWAQLVLGTLTSLFAFWVFTVELTNQIYNREVFPVYKWSDKHSPEETFGAAGWQGTLRSKAARLRQANYPTVEAVRAAEKKASHDHLDAPLEEQSTDSSANLHPGDDQ